MTFFWWVNKHVIILQIEILILYKLFISFWNWLENWRMYLNRTKSKKIKKVKKVAKMYDMHFCILCMTVQLYNTRIKTSFPSCTKIPGPGQGVTNQWTRWKSPNFLTNQKFSTKLLCFHASWPCYNMFTHEMCFGQNISCSVSVIEVLENRKYTIEFIKILNKSFTSIINKKDHNE